MNPFLNVFRGIITTLIGVVIMGLSIYFFFFGDGWEDYFWHLIGAFTIGVVLLIMPDDIPAFVRELANKFIFKKDKQQ
jgi:hypothetical protein